MLIRHVAIVKTHRILRGIQNYSETRKTSLLLEVTLGA